MGLASQEITNNRCMIKEHVHEDVTCRSYEAWDRGRAKSLLLLVQSFLVIALFCPWKLWRLSGVSVRLKGVAILRLLLMEILFWLSSVCAANVRKANFVPIPLQILVTL
ncbi:hypothetical protein DVH24_039372 [Malus domestica]|uniref:Uncharacterized protein n=1 Tax=Malus domestica TaxID=3750 RepID=A0A498I3L4_MALDO|nr:hypothetical protein DVH24_039372 [Malus domestica]